MDLSVYNRLVAEGDIDKAFSYKVFHAPQFIYKYISLHDEYDLGEMCNQRNKQKLDTLEKNCLWFSTYNQLNDSYEFKGFYFDISILGVEDDILEKFNALMDSYRNRKLICSFSSSSPNNMPMWTHYANNHKGFCIQYRVLRKPSPFNLYPVIYLDKRQRFTDYDMAKDYIALFNQFKTPDYEAAKKIDFRYNHLAMLKHSFWQYEDEYRIVVENQGIQSIPICEIPFAALSIECIYIGMNCSQMNADCLRHIAQTNGYEHRTMEYDDSSVDFALRSKGS